MKLVEIMQIHYSKVTQDGAHCDGTSTQKLVVSVRGDSANTQCIDLKTANLITPEIWKK